MNVEPGSSKNIKEWIETSAHLATALSGVVALTVFCYKLYTELEGQLVRQAAHRNYASQ